MRPPRLAEAADESRVRRLEKDQGRVEPLHGAQLPVRLRKFRKEVFLADVDDNRHPRDAFAAHKLCERWDERRWNVVDAEVTEIFECPNRLRFSRARQSRQDNKSGLGLPRRSSWRKRAPASAHRLRARYGLHCSSPESGKSSISDSSMSSSPASCNWCSSLSASFLAA